MYAIFVFDVVSAVDSVFRSVHQICSKLAASANCF